jgi:ABC-type Fe3+ transport system substrate-binding protein
MSMQTGLASGRLRRLIARGLPLLTLVAATACGGTAAPSSAPPAATQAPAQAAKPTAPPAAKPAAPAPAASSPQAAPAASSPQAAPASAPKASPAAAAAAPQSGKADLNAPAVQALYAAAKEEGTLSLWLQGTPEQYNVLADGFRATFPGINLQYFSALPEEAAPKLIAEAQASGGKVSADLLQANLPTAALLAQRNLLTTMDWTTLGLPKDRTVGENWGVGYFTAVNPLSYNPTMLSPEELPKSWEELGDPKWRGKLILETRGLSISGLWPVLGEQGVLDLTRKIMANDPLVITSQTTVMLACIAGQAPLVAAPLHYQVSEQIQKGAPIAMVPNLPATGRTIANVVLTGHHPNAGKLWAWWIGTDEGQEYVLKSQGAGLLTNNTNTAAERDLKAANIQVRVLTAAEETRQGELGRQMAPIITRTG